ncbi:restriction endonuclease subunit S [Enterococcus raffinosus]|uniref:Restriction endonuclease subunit S n=2 Tax=Enterococcus TaxID=1350 RepID=A0ABD5F5F6_ENTAV|nr:MULTISPECIES: restriction endonuclease subunit S [Enterococcus]MDT2513285.1 restriction endonuclease subunit S [Enterococcus avium]MDT2528975.1 restriction endonuclease subunit S [Enterococcus raffinosus]
MTPEQLKASILQRAMEGKLVPQDPNDEPASELLKRIKAEKEKLIKEGKIKRDKNETEIYRGDDGLHYEKFADGSVRAFEKDIPNGWAVTYFPEICALEKGSIKRGPFGSSITKAMFVPRGEDTYKVYEQGNAIRKTVEYGDYWLPKSDYQRLEGFAVKARDIIVSCAGTIGETFVIPKDAPEGVINQALLRLTLNHEIIDEQYFLLMFKSLVDTLKSNAVGSAIKNLASIKFLKYETPFLLPPIDEQRRIVSKVQEAFEKVELYGRWFNRLQTINKEFPEKLRKSILQYAMQGKLVPQDPNDEPVEVLLEKIRQEKQKLYEEGKLKKKDLQESIIYKGDDNSYYEKNGNSEVKLDDIPELPSTWEYARFKDIVSYYMGKTPPRSANEYWGDDIPWVSIADMPANGIITSTKEHVSHEAKKLFKDKISPAGTLLMSFKLTVGRVSLLGIEATHNEAIISIFPYADTDESLKMYLFKFLPQIANGGDSKDAIKGTTLNSQSINNLLIPMPPLEEQSRIIQEVAKFEDLIPQLG